MDVQHNVSLKPYNTFGIDVKAEHLVAFSSLDQLQEALEISAAKPRLILGGGSNVLFVEDVQGYVLLNQLKGISLVKEDEEHYYVQAGAGENWHRFVSHCVNGGFAGLENLSLIPGNVGASPMQNIGAYGVEIKDVFDSLQAYDITEGSVVNFNRSSCEFGYRESVFKRRYKNRFIILSVIYRLNKIPAYNTSYGAISQELEAMGVKELSIKAISEAVIRIRSSKLPDPRSLGNAGSFFKNPSVAPAKLEELKQAHPNLPSYPGAEAGTVKIAAGWLIEQCGWKGYRSGDAGCNAKQALVLVNYGNAKGSEILSLSEDIIQSVFEKFGITLEREVNVY